MRHLHALLHLRLIAIVLLLLLPATVTHAESQITLPFPPTIGDFPAGTYDEEGRRIGGARLSLVREGPESMRLVVESGMEAGAHTRSEAEMAVLAGDRGVRLLHERSLTHGPDGKPMDLLVVDHRRGTGTCTPEGGAATERAEVVPLPKPDRTANVPLNLLFLPLVQGKVSEVDFQLFLCGGGARVMDFRAKVAPAASHRRGKRIIEVTYGPDLGQVVSLFASALVPRLSFWFEADEQGTYLAHRIPLHSKGPEVMIVREGWSPGALVSVP